MFFFFLTQFTLKIRFLGQKVCSIANRQTHGLTHTDTEVNTHRRTPFQVLRKFSLNLSSRIGPIFSPPKNVHTLQMKITLYDLLAGAPRHACDGKMANVNSCTYICYQTFSHYPLVVQNSKDDSRFATTLSVV